MPNMRACCRLLASIPGAWSFIAPSRTTTRRIRSTCCALAASGHAAAPPSSVMNARRFMANHSFNHLVGAGEQGRGHVEAESLCRLEIDQELEFGGLINWDVARFGPFEDLMHIIGHAPEQLREVNRISHQPTGLDVIAVRTHGRQAVLLGELGDQLAVSVKVPFAADQYCVRPLLLHFSEDAPNLRRSSLLREHKIQ